MSKESELVQDELDLSTELEFIKAMSQGKEDDE